MMRSDAQAVAGQRAGYAARRRRGRPLFVASSGQLASVEAPRGDGALPERTRGTPARHPRRRRTSLRRRLRDARWSYVIGWLIGAPVPVLVVIYLVRSCT